MEKHEREYGIYSKLDFFQGVFKNVDFSFVLEFIGLKSEDFGSFFTDSILSHAGYSDQFVYKFENITIATSYANILNFENATCEKDFAHWIFSHIELRISGQGLDYLRSRGVNVDELLRRQSEVDELTGRPYFHVTRADFAFDLINYREDFLDQCIDYAQGRSDIRVVGIKTPMQLEIRSGHEKIFYVGSSKSDRKLRIYDKKLEQSDKFGLIKSSPVDYNIDSWIRIELQTRDKWAHRLLYGEGDYTSILRHIYEYYSFKGDDGLAAPFWTSLYNWDEIPEIIQNANWVSARLDKTKLDIQYFRAIDLIVPYARMYGIDSVLHDIYKADDSMFEPSMKNSYRRRTHDRRLDCLLDWTHDVSRLKGCYVLPTIHGTRLKLRPYDRR